MHRIRVALAGAICLLASGSALAGKFGTRCQQTFKDGWVPNLSHVYDHCAYFNNELDDTDSKAFYYYLNNGQGFKTSDHVESAGGVDTVDLFYVNTHGKAESSYSWLALYVGIATSNTWRFGDNGRKLKIFSQYACETMKLDNKTYDRWDQVFKGGLYLVTGSHDKVYDSWYTDDVGEDYADNLQDGDFVWSAWFDGAWDAYTDQDVAVFGTSSGDESVCFLRLLSMTGQNTGGFPRYRDGDMKLICAYSITDY